MSRPSNSTFYLWTSSDIFKFTINEVTCSCSFIKGVICFSWRWLILEIIPVNVDTVIISQSSTEADSWSSRWLFSLSEREGCNYRTNRKWFIYFLFPAAAHTLTPSTWSRFQLPVCSSGRATPEVSPLTTPSGLSAPKNRLENQNFPFIDKSCDVTN